MLRLREDARNAWGWGWLDDLARDTRLAWRTLLHSPGFAFTAVLTLALGIGVNTAMFSLVNSVLLRPLYEGSAAVVAVHQRSTAPGGGHRSVSYPNYLDLREATTSIFADLAGYSTDFVGLDAGEGVRRTMASGVTANYFDLLGAPLALGRTFTVGEERLGDNTGVAIISFSLWQQRGGDSNMLGQSVRVNGDPFTVVGIAREGFTGTAIPGPEVWLPVGAGRRNAHGLSVVGRLRNGASREGAAAAVATVGRRLEEAFPEVNKGYTFEVSEPSRLMFMPGPGSPARTTTIAATLMLMPAIVLLVACLNLADLLLARGHVRRKELAIRSSLGGGRGRLTRQLLTEGLLLSLAGGAVGLLFSKWATGLLMSSLHPVLPVAVNLPELDLDWRVLAGTAAFSLMAVLVFGAWPAWNVTGRAAVTDLKRQIGEEGRQPGGIRLGRALVVVQVALSLLLLASGGLFLMSALSAATADPGFRLAGGVLLEIDPDLAGYDAARSRQSHLALVNRLRTVPGVEAVTIGSDFPFSSMSASRNVVPSGTTVEGSRGVGAIFTVVGRDYARVLGLPMLAGRDFSEAEMMPSASERVAIVDDALAERLWPGESALGRLIQFLDGERRDRGPIRVIGIVPAVKHSLSNPHLFPHVYVPLGQHSESTMTLQLRVADETTERTMLATAARVIHEVDERMPILRRETWRDRVHNGFAVWLYRAGARVFLAFGVIALLLAVIGVYGVKSYVVARRTREFGIHLAIGAEPRALLWRVLWEGGRTTGLGIGIGLLLAVGAGQILQGVLYGINGIEPVVLVTAPLVLLASSLLASYIPALRATRVDPTVALRAE
jgi:predicted permease